MKKIIMSILYILTFAAPKISHSALDLKQCESFFIHDSHNLFDIKKANPHSLVLHHPKPEQHLNEIAKLAFKMAQAFADAKSKQQNLHEMYLQIQKLVQELKRKNRFISNEYADTDQKFLIKAIAYCTKQLEELSNPKSSIYVNDIEKLKSKTASPEDKNPLATNSKYFNELRKFTSTAAELSVGMHTPYVTHHDLLIQDIFSSQRELKLGPILQSELSKQIKQLQNNHKLNSAEIDLVFDNGNAWGEVKYLLSPVLNLWHHSSILNQVKNLNYYRDYMSSKGIQYRGQTYKIKRPVLHLFFVNGIAPSAAAELKALDVIVHGVLQNEPKQKSPKAFPPIRKTHFKI